LNPLLCVDIIWWKVVDSNNNILLWVSPRSRYITSCPKLRHY